MPRSENTRSKAIKKWFVRLAGPLLILYVSLLLVVTFVAQRDFRESYSAQLHLDLEKRAAALSYFYLERINDIKALSEDNAFDSFFANQDLGMSMEYGLRASLLKIARAIKQKEETTTLDEQPVFTRILFIDAQSAILADTDGASGLWQGPDPSAKKANNNFLQSERDTVILSIPYQYKGEDKGHLLAYVNSIMPFQQLVYKETSLDKAHIYILPNLMTHDEGLPSEIADYAHELTQSDHEEPITHRSGSLLLHAHVKATPFTLIAQYYPTGLTNYLISAWFIILLALLTLFILLGVTMANRIRGQNLVLSGRIEESARHRLQLHRQNQQLLEEIRKRQESEEQLSVQANFDSLTKLPNRSLMMDRLSQSLLKIERSNSFVVLLMLDLDHFKKVNDTLGHAAGDELLVEAAHRLENSVRESDTVARLGGDEFLVLLPDLAKRESVELICRKLLDGFSKPFQIKNHEFFITASIGVAISPDDGRDTQTLLKNVDIALYKAKELGRNTFRFFTAEMNERLRERQEMENLLIHALVRNEFFLAYQPILRISDRRMIGAEVLIRWQNPLLGLVPPSIFVPLCEDMGIIIEIGEWVLNQACIQANRWRELSPFRLAVNASSVQLRNSSHFLDVVNNALIKSHFPAQNLELEVTETIVLDDSATSHSILQGLHALGVRLSIDDFGTGYSALSYLKKFPFDTLKIDKSFVKDLPHDAGSVALARAILAMAHALSLEVVAEGIEEQEQVTFMSEQGCDFAQGFYFHKPMAPDELTKLLTAQANQCA